MAWNRRRQDQEDETSFFDVTCFSQLAENVAESVRKGARVVVYGTLKQRSWETDGGDRRSKVEILADEVAPSLKWATAEITKNERSGGDSRSEGDRSGHSRGDGGSRSGGDRGPVRPVSTAVADDEPF